MTIIYLEKEGKINTMLPELKYDDKGLIPAIIQDAENGDVLMMAYIDRKSVV